MEVNKMKNKSWIASVGVSSVIKVKWIIVFTLLCVTISGCAAGSLQVNPNDIEILQMTSETGCVAANITGSSGVIGGYSRVIVTWGELTDAAINWCIGR